MNLAVLLSTAKKQRMPPSFQKSRALFAAQHRNRKYDAIDFTIIRKRYSLLNCYLKGKKGKGAVSR